MSIAAVDARSGEELRTVDVLALRGLVRACAALVGARLSLLGGGRDVGGEVCRAVGLCPDQEREGGGGKESGGQHDDRRGGRTRKRAWRGRRAAAGIYRPGIPRRYRKRPIAACNCKAQ